MMEKDPMHLAKIQQGRYTRHMYFLLCIIPIFLISALLFYVVSMFSAQSEAKYQEYLRRAYNFNRKGGSASQIKDVALMLRMMPSANTEKNVMYMDFEEAEAGYMNKSVHYFDNTQHYFPTLNLVPEHVPFGNSKTLCLHLSWVQARLKRMYGMYKAVRDFPECTEALNPKFRWNDHDPTDGVDINIWVEDEYECSGETCNEC